MDGFCPFLRFEVKRWTVVTNADTEYKKGSCSDVLKDRKVDVKGLLLSDDRVLAQTVEIHKK